MYIAASFVNNLNRVDWLNKLRYSYTIEYYAAIKKTKANFCLQTR